MIDKILFKILILDGNEATVLSDKAYKDFRGLLIELSKVKYDIRYCTNKDCQCHPEPNIKKLVQDNQELRDFFTNQRLILDIEEIIYTLYEESYKNTIWDKVGDC